MSNILNTRCDDSKVALVMDDMACPHCVWIDGDFIKYARFYAGEWRLVGSIAVAADADPTFSKGCLCVNAHGNCCFAALVGNDLNSYEWTGSSWRTETVFSNARGMDVLAWGMAWPGATAPWQGSFGFPTLAAVFRNFGNKRLMVTHRKDGYGSWKTPTWVDIPPQANDEVDIKAVAVSDYVYLFWNGKDASSGQSWIGHAIWEWNNTDGTIIVSPYKVEMSAVEGDIASIDFVTSYEGEESSSSST